MKNRKQINTRIFITVIILVVALVPSLIASFLYYKSEQNSIEEQASNYEEQMFADMKNYFVALQDQLDKIQYEATSQFISLQMGKIETLTLKAGEVQEIHTFENMLQSVRRTASGVNNIYVINKKDMNTVYGSTYTFTRTRLLQKPWLEESYLNSKDWRVIPDHQADYLYSSKGKFYSSRCFSFVVGLVNTDSEGEFEYLLQIDMDSDYIYALIYNILVNEDDALALYYSDGKLAEKKNLDPAAGVLLEEELKKGTLSDDAIRIQRRGDFILTETGIPQLDMYVYKMSKPFAEMNNRLQRQIMILVLVSLAVAVFTATWITSFFMRPFEKLIHDTMVSISETSELKTVSVDSSSSYIQKMEEHFNALIFRVNNLIQSTLRQEKEKQNLEIKMLQAQISPHFLYNTLNSVKWMALMRKQPEIAEMITSLVDLLEYCCKDTDSLVPLSDEINFLKNYIRLQKMRNLDNAVEVVYTIDEKIREMKIIKFSLQPSIENAFVHAFPERGKLGARITVSGYTEDERLILKVEDNGIGFDEDTVKRNMTGIGIRNVDERIKLTFGEEYGQKIRSRNGVGTTVIIEQPIILGDEQTHKGDE